MKLKFSYKKKRIKMMLFFGLSFLILALLELFFSDESDEIEIAINIFYLLNSLYYLASVFSMKRYGYCTLEQGILKEIRFMRWGKAIFLKEVVESKYFAGEYILKTNKKEFRINGQIMDKNSLKDLKMALKKHKIAFSNDRKI